jgi:primosomal protein N' (replication factor Y)
MSTFVSCRECGYIACCPNCDIPLTFHYNDMNLICHHCGFIEQPVMVCPKCKSLAIKYFGSGTQRVEQEIYKLFGNVRVSRMDRDTTIKVGSHEHLYKSFVQNEIDIMIGTQMITKGWDLPNVRLIGIVSIDTMLNYPDFRADERVYQLITQMSGRTGRGEHIGKVLIQTYSPDNPIFKAIQTYDYSLFYNRELSDRKELGFPPFANLVKLLYNNENQYNTKAGADRIAELLKEYPMIGPSPAFIPKLSGQYRYQLVIKYRKSNKKKLIEKILQITNDNWSIDIDPASLI